ncbi:MAG: ankyrin repeat domain-containing protein [Treponema sp.]|jgi:ankyrin repeat protein|nr:ankyrin repeat domain-containing protein [Treponema sp.]
MMNKNLFLAAVACGTGLLISVLGGCSSNTPAVQQIPNSDATVLVEDDVWTLLVRGEGDRARRYFMGEVDVNATDSLGRTPLHLAAENRDSNLAVFFIALGARVNALDRQDRIPLDISAEKMDAATARVLASGGSDIHHSPQGGGTPAQIGVKENGDFLKALLIQANLENTDASGRSILHIAAEAGSAGAIDTILKAGKNDLAKKDSQGKTALDITLERTGSRNHAEAAEHLILAGGVSENPLYTYIAPAARTSNYNIRSADGMAPLHYIAREGYMGYIEFVLEKQADVNIKNASGATPLHEAARSGNIRVMETLLDRGAGVNIQDAKGNTVLHIACPPQTHLEALKLFLSRGANVNLRDEHGDSPLHIAIILNRSPELIQTLLSAGSDVSIRNIDGKTPLYLAVQESRSNYPPLLLQYNSDIFAADNDGVTPFEMALTRGSPLLYTLITDETVLHNDNQGNTMLHIIIRNRGGTEIINYVLDKKGQVNARNKEGDTALHVAVRMNQQETGELLLNRGADIFAPNAKGESPLYLSFPLPGRDASELRRWMLTSQTLAARDGLGNTALHYAAQWQYEDWIPLLIQLGAAAEAANATGETPLFAGVKQNAPGTIRVLIASGANLGSRDTLGNTALHAAVRWNARRSAETLLDLGLDINAHALNGKTPLHDSIRLGMNDIESLLLARGADLEVRDADGNTPFVEAILAGFPVTMERLVDNGADPNTRNFRGDTPLHIAAAIERNDIAVLLLGWGASIHARNSSSRTPFQNALAASPQMVRTLLTRDRLYGSDDYGNSPLHIAVQEKAPVSVIRTIMDIGAKTSALDSEGRTPLRLALDLNDWSAAKILADSGSDVYLSARDGRCPAELALSRGYDAVRAIFSGRAITSKDGSGNTVLHYAAQTGDTAVIMQLLELGAPKGVKNIAAESPADIAQRWRHPDAAALLN